MKCRQAAGWAIGALAIISCLVGSHNAVRAGDTEAIRATGRPDTDQKGLHCDVWFDDGVWHVRAGGAKNSKRHSVKGTITVTGGTVSRGALVGAEQTAHPETGKTKKQQRKEGKAEKHDDDVTMHKGNGGFDFEFTVRGQEDGLDFSVSKDAKSVQFQLLVDGDDDPKKVCIGAAGAHPAKASFELPARPE